LIQQPYTVGDHWNERAQLMPLREQLGKVPAKAKRLVDTHQSYLVAHQSSPTKKPVFYDPLQILARQGTILYSMKSTHKIFPQIKIPSDAHQDYKTIVELDQVKEQARQQSLLNLPESGDLIALNQIRYLAPLNMVVLHRIQPIDPSRLPRTHETGPNLSSYS
jgi:hypothetical protein